MFSTGGNKVHSARKRMMSNIYSKTVIMVSQTLLAQTTTIMYDRFLPYLEAASRHDEGVMNIYALLSASTMDIVNVYIFGLRAGSNLIDDPQQLEWFLGLYNSRRPYSFWPQEFPGFSSFVEKWLGFRFAPKWVDDANEEIEKWTRRMCDKAQVVLAQGDMTSADTPVVYQQLLSNFRKQVKAGNIEEADVTRLLASEVLGKRAQFHDLYMRHALTSYFTCRSIGSRLRHFINNTDVHRPRTFPAQGCAVAASKRATHSIASVCIGIISNTSGSQVIGRIALPTRSDMGDPAHAYGYPGPTAALHAASRMSSRP
jgi:hypothetical protein